MLLLLDLWAVGLALATYRYLSRRNRPPLAPGPPGYPLIGNLFDMPTTNGHITYTEWAKRYGGEILNINVCGTNIVILNSLRVINELLDKRSSIYSSRPQFTMLSELMGWGFLFSAMPYHDGWRRRRRLFQRFFPASRAQDFQPQQRTHVRRLLPKLIDHEQNFIQALRHYAGGIAITMAYGIDVKSSDDPYVKASEYAISLVNYASAPGKYLVDALPLLKYIPTWFPGAKFKRDAKEWYKVAMDYREVPFQATKRDIERGVAPHSYVSTCLENVSACTAKERIVREEEIKDTAAIFFGGGTDTTMAVLLTFMLAIVQYPDVQTKAQEELDRVVGPDRLPDFHDAPHLPYLNALLKEVTRWHPPGPIAIPHSTTEDDICDGYFIPKDSIVIPNIWIVLQNPEEYPNPTQFNPDRFLTRSGVLNPDVLDPVDLVFGFGRRACPGSHMALSTLFIIASCILHTMRVESDEAQEVEFTDTLFPAPKPFNCVIRPRSQSAERLIRDEALGAY